MRDSQVGTVIVVEDDPSVSQALERILRLGGLRPVTYPSAEALLVRNGVVNAVCLILDVQLPGLSGFALRDQLSAKGALPPVIFITAFDEPDARARADRAGAAAFLTKPFSGKALLETIHKSVRPS
ncbi:MAG TPA: response regulator [Casimicrobiaceae bacterium]|nr:response regulator [Casimicrobiaceae bacterium]